MSELYLFTDNGINRGFSPTVFSKTLLGVTFVPTIIIRSAINLIDNFAKSPVVFKFDRTHSYAKELLNNLPETPIVVTVYRNGTVYWKGNIIDVKANVLSIEISCDSLYTTLQREGLPARISLTCRHTLYGANCGAIQSSFANPFTVSGIASKTFTVSGITNPTGFFSRGIATINGQTRAIVTQAGTTITLSNPFTGVQSGILNLYPGCALTQTACIGFSNLDNFGGFAYIPPKNPFSNTGAL